MTKRAITSVVMIITTLLTTFFTSVRARIEPTHKWIENFLPLLSACNRQYALPIILGSIESAPEKATQELIRLSGSYRWVTSLTWPIVTDLLINAGNATDYLLFRLQVQQVVEACQLDTLSKKLRKLITAELTAPTMASSEIKRKKKTTEKSPVKGVKESTSSQAVSTCTVSSGGFLSSLIKFIWYSALLITASSQIEATKPTYQVYAAPSVEQYVEVN